jgi:thioredoxin reductase (NADPH)
MRHEQIVIVGAGPGGCAAAIQCRRLGFSPLILERTGRVGGLIKNAFNIENYPALPSITGAELTDKLAAQLQKLSLSITEGELIAIAPGIDPGPGTNEQAGETPNTSIQIEVTDSTGGTEQILTNRLILATGTTALHLPIPGAVEAQNRALFYELFDLINSQRWTEIDPEQRRIAVIGGGEAALNYSLTLANLGATVSILVRADQFTARGKLVELVESNAAIKVDLSTVSTDIRPAPRSLTMMCEKQGDQEERNYHAVLCAIGRKSKVAELIPDFQTGALRPITTDRSGLYVIGDARAGALGQVAIAAGDGLAAAAAAVAGREE